jgi:hypothetical protein
VRRSEYYVPLFAALAAAGCLAQTQWQRAVNEAVAAGTLSPRPTRSSRRSPPIVSALDLNVRPV